jgi:hypothetical protein
VSRRSAVGQRRRVHSWTNASSRLVHPASHAAPEVTSMRVTGDGREREAGRKAGRKVREDAIRLRDGRVSCTSKTALRAFVRTRALIETDQKAKAMPTRSSKPWFARRPPLEDSQWDAEPHPGSREVPLLREPSENGVNAQEADHGDEEEGEWEEREVAAVG